jgi:hypothetical protein
MDNLLTEIRRVQRRLAVERFLGSLGWCLFGSLLSAAVMMGAARFLPLGIVDWQCLAGLLAAGLIAAIGWTLISITPTLQAAMEIDHRFGLKERISSTLAMHPADRESEAGQALLADAAARLRRIEVLEQFPLRPSRRLLLPLLPAVLLVAIAFFHPAVKETVAAAETLAAPPLEVKKSADDLRQKLVVRRQQAEKEGLQDATKLFQRLEEGTNEIQKETQREKALVKLNDLARELQERRNKLGGSEALQRQMEKVEDKQHGPADDLTKALSQGDFQKAAKALENLKEKLAGSQLDATKKEELARQMEQLKQQIDHMAQDAKNAQADLQKRAESMKLSGNSEAASKLEDEIQKLQQQGPQMDALKDLADKLGQSCQQMQAGNNSTAAESMQEALQKMQDMAHQQSEVQMLDGALEQLSDARRQMNCESCGGKGCEKCLGQSAMEIHEHGVPGGSQPGTQPGNPVPPEPAINAKFFDSRVRQTVGKGPGQVTGLAAGPNLKNRAEAEIQTEAAAVEHGSTDPLSGQRLPKKQSEHVREYFDSFREGK